MSIVKRISIVSPAVIGLLAWPHAASSQQAAHVRDLEEVVVTAQRRSESVQDVPFAITAISGNALEQLNASNGFEAIANGVTGLQALQTSPLDTQFFMRGISSGALTLDQVQLQSAVGIYFDESATDLSAMNPNYQMADIDRVEVLRGPQGTLYGAGAMAGAIRIIPRKPDLRELDYGVGVTLSDTDAGSLNQVYDVGLNAPIKPDVFGLRAVAYSSKLGGVVDNVVTGKKDEDGSLSQGGRISLRAQLGERLTADLMFAYQETSLDGSGRSALSLKPYQTGSIFTQNDTNKLAEVALNYHTDKFGVTSITSYLEKDNSIRMDGAGLPTFFGMPFGAPNDFITRLGATSLGEELRVQSRSEGPLQWLVGAFYSKVDRKIFQTIDIPGVEAATGAPLGSMFGNPTDRVLSTYLLTHNSQYAAFGQVSFQISEHVGATAGARYFHGEQNPFVQDQGVLEGGVYIDHRHASDGGINPNLNIAYKFSADHNVYVQAARGFRLGGPNYIVPVSLCGPDLSNLGLSEAPQSFKSDSVWNYEIGTKNTFDGGRVTLNVAGYVMKWADIQQTVKMSCGYFFQENLGRAQVHGVEAEFKTRVTESLTLRANATFTDATLKDPVPVLGIAGGERTPLTPKVAGSAGFDYRIPVGKESSVFFSGDAEYVGSRTTGVTKLDSYNLAAFTLASVRVGYRRGAWTSYLFANNLFNERAELNKGFDAYGSLPGDYVVYSRPRTIGVTFRREF